MQKILLNVLLFIIANTAISQTISVKDANSQEPIPFVHVILKEILSNKEIILVTDTAGKTCLSKQINPDKNYAVTISYIGYQKLTDTLKQPIQQRIFYLHSEILALDEIVVTAQYAPNSPEKAVHKIKVIDKKKIESMGAQNLRDVLTNEMNIRISQDNILGSGMNMQGISGQNVKILIDGVPVTGRLNGNIDISQINMNNVERIEIIEGPLSVNYGTDALAGTINIITKKSQKETFSINSFNYYESNGQYNTTSRIGFRKNNEVITLTGGRNYFDGWRNNDNPFQLEKVRIADSLRYKNWKPKEQYFATLYYGHYLKNLKLNYTSNYFREQITNKGLPRKPYFETAFDDYYNTKRFNNSASLTGQLNKKYYLNAIVGYNYFQRIKNTFFNDLTTLEKTLTENQGDQDSTIFKVLMTRGSISTTKDSSKINYELGYDINNEIGFGIRIKNNTQQITDYAIFTTAEYKPFQKIIIRPGVRLIYNTAYKAPIVPSVNFRWQVSKHNAIRFSYARGFRSPSLKELYFYFVDINHNVIGNENLKAEYSHNLSLTLSNTKQFKNNSLKSEISPFYNYIENMITLAQLSGTQYSYFNVDKYQTLGVQSQSELAWKQFKFNIGFAYIGKFNQLSDEYSVEKFDWSPELKCNLLYEWKKQELTAAFFYKYTGSLPVITMDSENNPVNSHIDDYHTADLSITKHFLKKKIGFSAGCKNIFNVVNITGSVSDSAHSSSSNSISIGMGRTYFFKLDINLNSAK